MIDFRKTFTSLWSTPDGFLMTRDTLLMRIIPSAVLVGVLLAIAWSLTSSAPRAFTTPQIVKIPAGATLSSEARVLKNAHVIRSETLFKLTAVVLGGEKGLIAGSYFFSVPQNVFVIANRMVSGAYDLYPTKVTIPEGATLAEMAQILGDKLGYFDTQKFLTLTEGKEGYLFPDTYYFLPTEEPEVVIAAMENNFSRAIDKLEPDIQASGHSLHDIVTMASLLEEEARTPASRRMISGILWHRIQIGMKLQVDAVFPYILGKNTYQVTKDDLKMESPYNTYLYKGLPIGPISNPGIDSLEAAVHPTKSTYLYYVSDKEGNLHYSNTYAEHLRNVRLYVK